MDIHEAIAATFSPSHSNGFAFLVKIILFADACANAVRLQCANGGYQDPIDCTRCRCPEGLGGNTCDQPAPSFTGTLHFRQLVYTHTNWGTAPRVFFTSSLRGTTPSNMGEARVRIPLGVKSIAKTAAHGRINVANTRIAGAINTAVYQLAGKWVRVGNLCCKGSCRL